MCRADEFTTDQERLGQAAGMGLDGVGDGEAELRPSPSSRSKPAMSVGVEISRISRIPASIRVESG